MLAQMGDLFRKSYDHYLLQAGPVKPSKQLHVPVVRSQEPLFEHSAYACALVDDVGTSAQALPEGQVLALQSGAW